MRRRCGISLVDGISWRSIRGRTVARILTLVVEVAASTTEAAPLRSDSSSVPQAEPKIGILLVSHGSRSATWRKALFDLEGSVRAPILANHAVAGVKTAFMEYTEPSIATGLREFDAKGCTDIVIVPVFLTVSSHTFDDIPTIIGKKVDPQSLETLKIERVERYTPRANAVITPNLDFPDFLNKNVLRRVEDLSRTPAEEGLVLIAYGDATYEREWTVLLEGVGEYVRENTGIDVSSHGWCGHVAHYDPAKTTQAIQDVLRTKQTAVVVPVLVAHDEDFQIRIIGDGIANVSDNESRVLYRPDAILPDVNLEQWVIDVAHQYVSVIEIAHRQASDQNP